ncbi:UDP-N-acetylmuramoyl-L-alanine--D-glutamate ligase [candidate division WOR-3 bacterium]|nr:UDP-N-acetylmuramoyl-L-alanine--D-glutamate ligase [candidate division WOR-3 bacterium]
MRILLLGLGRANLPVARYCIDRGDAVVLYEEDPASLSREAKAMLDDGRIALHQGGEYDRIISSPGFPVHKDIISHYQSQDVPIIDEIEFTYQELRDPAVIAITGTNGKSTTAALVHAILSTAGIDCFLGGNLAPGNPFSQALFEPRHPFYVLEVSSFQLMRIQEFRPQIAVLTNISTDHLNWHASIEEYYQAKRALFKNQTPDDQAVLNHDDVTVRTLTDGIAAQRIYFGRTALKGVHCNGSFRCGSKELFPCSVSKLQGEHNIMNALAAIAVSTVLAINIDSQKRGISTFKPLPHRLEDCGLRSGVRYINNSMCTNGQAAIASFKAIPDPKIVIVGGKEKGDAAHEYLELLVREAKACIILGENAVKIKKFFESMHYDRFAIATTMDEAVDKARSFSRPGDTIILNPGYASFGLFRDFEERGEAFRHAAC